MASEIKNIHTKQTSYVTLLSQYIIADYHVSWQPDDARMLQSRDGSFIPISYMEKMPNVPRIQSTNIVQIHAVHVSHYDCSCKKLTMFLTPANDTNYFDCRQNK